MIKIAIIILLSLYTIAGEKPTLTIYTYDAFASSWGTAPKIKKIFEKEHNCNLKFVSVSSSIGALRKIQLEGKRTKADILLGLDTSIAQEAKETGLFIKHEIDSPSLNLPKNYSDDSFLPFDYSYFAFIYDSNKLKNPLTSFEELVNMPKEFKIVIQDPRSSTTGLGLLLWVKEVYGDKSADYWKKLSPHILTITKGWSEAYGLFLKGEADMVFSFTTSPAYHMIEEQKMNYRSANFKEGHYMQIEVSGILKSSKNIDLAREFLRFTQSEAFADIIPTSNWTYPIIKTKKGLPKAFRELEIPSKTLLMDGGVVQKNRKGYIDEWLGAMER